MIDSSQTKIQLQEVSLIRPFLITLLVFYHAFIIYDGGWEQYEGYRDIIEYKWAARLSYSFMLETFVFISGYLFSYQTIHLGRELSLVELIEKKISRLILPCWTFGIIYVSMFGEGGTCSEKIYTVLSGAGHLWFLPMLFWCFIGGGILLKKQIASVKMIPLLLFVALLSYNPLPMRLNNTMYYFFFFYLGILFYKNREIIINKVKLNYKLVSLLWIFFFIAFIVGTVLRDYLLQIKSISSFFIRQILQILINFDMLAYSLCGVISVYTTSMLYKNNNVIEKIKPYGKYCFSIYIFQQFILMYLYCNTSLYLVISPLLLPIVCFVVTLFYSFLLAWVVKKI